VPNITIYTGKLCPYCTAAKRLLQDKGVDFTEIDVTFDPAGRSAMAKRANGKRTVPQIFIGERHIGGCNELYALEHEGGLDPLLQVG
jgi:glutaredoxin 3